MRGNVAPSEVSPIYNTGLTLTAAIFAYEAAKFTIAPAIFAVKVTVLNIEVLQKSWHGSCMIETILTNQPKETP